MTQIATCCAARSPWGLRVREGACEPPRALEEVSADHCALVGDCKSTSNAADGRWNDEPRARQADRKDGEHLSQAGPLPSQVAPLRAQRGFIQLRPRTLKSCRRRPSHTPGLQGRPKVVPVGPRSHSLRHAPRRGGDSDFDVLHLRIFAAAATAFVMLHPAELTQTSTCCAARSPLGLGVMRGGL